MIVGQDFLCPINIDTLLLQGKYDSENFSYAKIAIEGCNLGSSMCANDTVVSNTALNFVMLKQAPNILGQTRDEMIQYVLDWKHYYYLDPTHS